MTMAEALEPLLQEALRFIPRLVAALVVFVVSIFVSALAGRWARKTAATRIDDEETLRLLARLARWTVIVLGIIVALDQVDFDVTGFVAGLGIAGLTIGFALQDITRNFIAGILLLIRQPFDIGDAVEVAGVGGTVLDITSRDTVLKTWDGVMVILPNLDVFTSAITNYSALPLRRRDIQIGLGYAEDVQRATRAFLEAMGGVEGVQADPAPTLRAEELGASALGLVAQFWVDQEAHSLLDVHSEVVRAVKEAAEREEIDLPYPIQTVRWEGPLAIDQPAEPKEKA